MIFSNPEYIFLFLPVVVAVHILLVKLKLFSGSRIWLVLSSSYFYSFSSVQSLVLLYGSLICNYCISRYLAGTGAFRNASYRKPILVLGIAANISFLGFYKYSDFLIGTINQIREVHVPYLQIALPLAISFYTFQQISFLVDSFRKEVPECTFINYCFYVLFFPQLIAGPILRYKEVSHQLNQYKCSVNWTNISTGIFVFSLGLFKKTIIADSFAIFANAGFNTDQTLNFLQAWSTSLSYTFQLYYDFSGYTDMAIGTALFFNIRLPINFNSPYKACNIQEFWQHWHMTLSRWLRDYLYIPLGGNRTGYSRTLINFFLTFLLAGVWHGAGWTFVVWGMLHGVAMVIHRIWQKVELSLPRAAAWLITFFFINIAWVFFRAPTLSDAARVLNAMFSFEIKTPELITQLLAFGEYADHIAVLALNGPVILVLQAFFLLIIIPMITFFCPNSMQMIRFSPYEGKFVFKTNLSTAFFITILFFISFLTFVGNVVQSDFIYSNF